jgi:hypothetical protein
MLGKVLEKKRIPDSIPIALRKSRSAFQDRLRNAILPWSHAAANATCGHLDGQLLSALRKQH